MKITLPIIALAAASTVSGAAIDVTSTSNIVSRTLLGLNIDLHFLKIHFGAYNEPWKSGGWGWHLGKTCQLPKWQKPEDTKPLHCKLFLFKHKSECQDPKPPTTPALPCSNGYATKFKNYKTVGPEHTPFAGQTVGAATIDNENYLTYGLVDTLDQCFKVCNDIPGCAFVNFYEDLNSDVKEGLGGAGKFTCAAYKACSGTEKLTNFGGQDQGPGHELTRISSSSGYCKSSSC